MAPKIGPTKGSGTAMTAPIAAATAARFATGFSNISFAPLSVYYSDNTPRSLGREPFKDGHLHREDLQNLVVARLVAHGDDRHVRLGLRRPNLDHLGDDTEAHAGPRRLRPGELKLGADEPVGERYGFHEHPHGQRRSMPAACCEAVEQRPL